MKNEDILNITSLEQAFNALEEILDDKKKLVEIRTCMNDVEVRFNEVNAYGDKLIADITQALDAWMHADEFEKQRLHAKALEMRAEVDKLPPIMRKIQELIAELQRRSDVIAAKYD